MTTGEPSVGKARREEGSAYLLALLGVVVLTILGLTLSLITQTEMHLGANERTLQRVFYAADAGFGSSVPRALVRADYTSRMLSLTDLHTPVAFNFRHTIDVSPFFPILTAPCNLCQINNSGSYGTKQYSKVSHAMTTVAQRSGGPDGNPAVLAQKTLSAMVDIQPIESTPEAHVAIEDPDEMKKIRF